jgi:CRP-like cAMP-binding protein
MMTRINMNYLRKSRLFQGFSDDEFEDFCGRTKLKAQNLEKRQILVLQGDHIDDIAIVQSGTLFGEKSHGACDSQLMEVCNALDIILLEAYFSENHVSPTSIIASTPASIIWISGPHYILRQPDLLKKQGLRGRSKLLENLLSMMAEKIIRISCRSDALSKYTARGKMLAYLSSLTERLGCATVNIGMNQEMLARYLGVTRATLSVELHKMQAQGLIAYKGQTYTLLTPSERISQFK